MINPLLLFIKIIHWLLISFIIAVPFIGNEWWLTMHAIIIPGIVIHWLTNNNVCSLTYLESRLSGVSMSDTFIGKILFPFFEVNNKIIYFIVLLLLFITLWKLDKTGFRLLKLCFWVSYQIMMIILNKIKQLFFGLFGVFDGVFDGVHNFIVI